MVATHLLTWAGTHLVPVAGDVVSWVVLSRLVSSVCAMLVVGSQMKVEGVVVAAAEVGRWG